jgi:hypothetical protein
MKKKSDEEYIELIQQSKVARSEGNYIMQRKYLAMAKELIQNNKVSEETITLAAYL